MMRRMPTKEWSREPCNRCGKTPHSDYDGYCLECAEDLALRGLIAPPSDPHSDEASAQTDSEHTTDDKAL
jgi:hypothetical protein